MNDCTTSKQNFESSYIYKVEEREESEKIFCHSDRGLVSIETNELPKVTRYFLKNNRGEPQGYIERKLIPNFHNDMTGDGDKNPQNCTGDKVVLQPVPQKENTKMKIPSHTTTTLKNGKKLNRFGKNWKKFGGHHELSSPLNSSAFERRKNYTHEYPSSNTSLSERTFNIKQPDNRVDSSIERNVKRHQLMSAKSFSKLTTKKSQRLFCNDPNKRLKNLFTIIKPTEKSNEHENITNGHDIDLLNKTKDILVKLIDNELQRIRPDEDATKKNIPHRSSVVDKHNLKKLKFDCIGKIEEQLELMKRLQS